MKAHYWTALAALAFTANANAAEAFVELAVCDFNQVENGVFWQEGRYTRNKLNTQCLAIGLQGNFARFWGPSPDWGWRGGLIATSSWQHRSNVATFYDDEIGRDPATMTCDTTTRGPGAARGCYTVHSGSGNLHGFFLALTYESHLGGGFRLTPEIGLLFYRMKQDNTVYWQDPTTADKLGGVQPAPGNHGTTGENSDMASTPSVFFGLTLRYKAVYVFARHYENQGGHPLALTDGTFRQYGAGAVLFKF